MLFDFSDYRDYLRQRVKARHSERGFKSQLAAACRIQKSYLSLVLKDKAHLSLEQASNVSRFLCLSDDEIEFFLDLVMLARTENRHLREVYLRRLDQARQKQMNLAEKFKEPKIDEKNQALYYSSWIWSAIHLCTDIPALQLADKIAKRLDISQEVVSTVLKELAAMNLVEQVDGRWKLKAGNMHLPKDSPLIMTHHQNWRNLAVLNSTRSKSDGLHYTVAQTHSKEDLLHLRQQLVEFIEKMKKRVKNSPAEIVTCCNLDFYSV